MIKKGAKTYSWSLLLFYIESLILNPKILNSFIQILYRAYRVYLAINFLPLQI